MENCVGSLADGLGGYAPGWLVQRLTEPQGESGGAQGIHSLGNAFDKVVQVAALGAKGEDSAGLGFLQDTWAGLRRVDDDAKIQVAQLEFQPVERGKAFVNAAERIVLCDEIQIQYEHMERQSLGGNERVGRAGHGDDFVALGLKATRDGFAREGVVLDHQDDRSHHGFVLVLSAVGFATHEFMRTMVTPYLSAFRRWNPMRSRSRVWRKGIRVFPGQRYGAAREASVMRLDQIVYGLWLLAAVGASAREGYLKTRDGKIFEGHLRFVSNAVVVVNVPRESRVEVGFTNLAELTFLPEGEAEPEALFGATTPEESGELPVSWSSEDVGGARRAGSSEFRRGKFRVRSAGTNALGSADACHFVFKPASDRHELVARVSRVQMTDPWARAGLMIRESLTEGARNVFLSISAARGGVFSWRERFGEESGVLLDRGMSPGWWLKLKRDGNVFTALKSPNGIRWSVTERFTMSLSKDCYAGLAWSRFERIGL
jgi:hypothetical protein